MKKLVLFLGLLVSTFGYSDVVEVESQEVAEMTAAAEPCDPNAKQGMFFKSKPCEVSSSEHNRWLFEAKAGYFFPTSDRFDDIYGGGGMYTIEVSAQAYWGFYPFLAGSYFSESGKSIGCGTRTVITMAPIDVGLKYIFNTSKYVDVYLGLGAVFDYLNMKDESCYVDQDITKWGYGGIAKGGLYVNFTKNFFIDIFGDYRFVTVDFDNSCKSNVVRHDADISGLTIGGGIGYRY